MNNFESYQLSDRHILEGSVLNEIQRRVFQNALSQIAHQILNLTFDPLNPVQFGLDHAALTGQKQAYEYILLMSEESKQALVTLAQMENQS